MTEYELKGLTPNKPKRDKFKISSWIIIVIILMLISFQAGAGWKNQQTLTPENYSYDGEVINRHQNDQGELVQDVDFNLYWKLWDILKATYVDKDQITDQELFYGSLKGMVSSLKDPYTTFLDPKLAKKFDEDLAGSFEGIGAEIGLRNEILTIIAPLNDTPADKAGLQPGDKIYAIDGESTAGITIDEAVNKIRGEKGTQVTLTVYSPKSEETRDISITRGTIVIKSVKSELRDDNILVITVSSFNDDTASLFDQVIANIDEQKITGIILDLRGNPGGYLNTAIDMASNWIESGPVVLEQFDENDQTEYQAKGQAKLSAIKTVVLVDQGSASASEIVSGALQDYGKATIVGEQTYGKGSVQTLKDFADGSAVKITVAKWLTPKGRSINEEGITPDIEVEYTLDDFQANQDPQLDKAVEIINTK